MLIMWRSYIIDLQVNYASFVTKLQVYRRLKQHIRVQDEKGIFKTLQKPFVCYICKKLCRSVNGLQSHLHHMKAQFNPDKMDFFNEEVTVIIYISQLSRIHDKRLGNNVSFDQ